MQPVKVGIGIAASLLLGAAPGPPEATSVRVYVGTFTSPGDNRGIYRLRLDLGSGVLTEDGQPVEAESPAFLTFSRDGQRLFAVNETGADRDAAGGVSAYHVERQSGALAFLNRQPAAGGGACHLSLDRTERHLMAANYASGNVSVFPVLESGRLGPPSAFAQHRPDPAQPGRPPHAHSADFDAHNRFAIVADLGLDRLFSYPFDATRGTLGEPRAFSLPKGAGPRHFVFHPSGHYGYLINELNSTLAVLAYDGGRFSELQTVSTLPAGWIGKNSTAEIGLSPDGRFLYGSNRGHDSLAIFAVDANSGRLTPVGHEPTQGRTPRHFAIDPSGAFLLAANQGSGSIVAFRVDSASGKLTPTGSTARVPQPVCIAFQPR